MKNSTPTFLATPAPDDLPNLLRQECEALAERLGKQFALQDKVKAEFLSLEAWLRKIGCPVGSLTVDVKVGPLRVEALIWDYVGAAKRNLALAVRTPGGHTTAVAECSGKTLLAVYPHLSALIRSLCQTPEG